MRFALLLAVSCLSSLYADTISLKSHSTLSGKFVGGDAQTLRMETSNGIRSVAITDVDSISFENSVPSAAPASPTSFTQSLEDYVIRLAGCGRNGTESVTCTFTATNLRADRQIAIGAVYEVDSQGNLQQAQQATLSSQRAIYNTPVSGKAVFGGVTPAVNTIAKLSLAFASSGPSGNVSFEVVFRNIPLTANSLNMAPGVPIRTRPRRSSVEPPPPIINPPAMLACSAAPEMPRMVLDGYTAVWAQRDGSVAEQDVRADVALFARQADGSRKQVGASYDTVAVDTEGTLPNLVEGVTKASGVASVLVVADRTTKRPGILGSTIETSGRQQIPVRVSLLADGGLAVWTEGGKPSIYPATRVRGLLKANVAAIQDGRFLLTDGTVEDGVIERLIGDNNVLTALPVGIGAARCEAAFGCLMATRSSTLRPSYKYKWRTKGTPVMCVKQIAFDLLLLQNGELHRIVSEGRVVDEPFMRDVADYAAQSSDEWAVVKTDGALWYRALNEPLEKAKGVSNARRAWLADEGSLQSFRISGVTGEYWRGAWFISNDGKLFRWGQSVSLQHGEAEASNPVQLSEDLDGTVAMEVHDGATVALRSDGALLSWMPSQPVSDSFLDARMRPARWVHVGGVAEMR